MKKKGKMKKPGKLFFWLVGSFFSLSVLLVGVVFFVAQSSLAVGEPTTAFFAPYGTNTAEWRITSGDRRHHLLVDEICGGGAFLYASNTSTAVGAKDSFKFSLAEIPPGSRITDIRLESCLGPYNRTTNPLNPVTSSIRFFFSTPTTTKYSDPMVVAYGRYQGGNYNSTTTLTRLPDENIFKWLGLNMPVEEFQGMISAGMEYLGGKAGVRMDGFRLIITWR